MLRALAAAQEEEERRAEAERRRAEERRLAEEAEERRAEAERQQLAAEQREEEQQSQGGKWAIVLDRRTGYDLTTVIRHALAQAWMLLILVFYFSNYCMNCTSDELKTSNITRDIGTVETVRRESRGTREWQVIV